uniref:Disease resistance R13L4/SHOC-2-like LRR domain-containing protein n=1 Tax=Daucus carota subsp. sativus TaxID=79200 RepID=A0A175YNK2_DAUCS
MAKALHTLGSTFILPLVLVMLAGLKEGFVEGQSGHLPQEEVKALREIANQVGKKDWNFSVNPCDKDDPNISNWNTTKIKEMPQYNNSVLCNCSYPGDICHVESMFLKGQDLDGIPPPSLAKLLHIKHVDFTRNYLHGNIPPEWASTNLEYISFTVNRLSGPIPGYLGNISTLRYLSLEHNMFNGTVPPELGKLANLINLTINVNYLTGQLPMELSNLTNLEEMRLSTNNFSGKLPDFQSWKQLDKLEIIASGFDGPIPSSISSLSNLTELYITNLNGGASKFPQLENMTKLKTLMLRSCNISGEIPTYLSQFSQLQKLDLSFNNLAGEIHSDLTDLKSLEILYLTNNSLTGNIPQWIKDRNPADNIDLSYNKFSLEPQPCRDSLNLFRSYGNNLTHGNCLDRLPCSEDRYSLHINCGGEKVTIGNRTYEGDEDSVGPAKYDYEEGYWGANNPPKLSNSDQKRKIIIAVVVVALGLLLLTFSGISWWKGYLGSRLSREEALKGLDLQTGVFTFQQIKAATDNFAAANKIGEGGFGPVFKALNVQENGNLLDLVDQRLGSNYNKEEAVRMIKVALLCTNSSPALRPTMSCVLSMLKGDMRIQKLKLNHTEMHGEDYLKFQGLRDKYGQGIYGSSSAHSQTFGDTSDDIKYGSSSTSGHDLYTVNLQSQ